LMSTIYREMVMSSVRTAENQTRQRSYKEKQTERMIEYGNEM
jgi:hypothetical protein